MTGNRFINQMRSKADITYWLINHWVKYDSCIHLSLSNVFSGSLKYYFSWFVCTAYEIIYIENKEGKIFKALTESVQNPFNKFCRRSKLKYKNSEEDCVMIVLTWSFSSVKILTLYTFFSWEKICLWYKYWNNNANGKQTKENGSYLKIGKWKLYWKKYILIIKRNFSVYFKEFHTIF